MNMPLTMEASDEREAELKDGKVEGGLSGEKRMPDRDAANRRKLVWIACGNRNGLSHVSQGTHRMLKEKEVPHVWNVGSHAPDGPEWADILCLFAQ
jgi:hypothetical protein